MSWPPGVDQLPPIILVGHSLGGAVVTELAKSGRLGSSLLAYAVLDVVEGSAMDALHSMQTYLSTRPQGFNSLKEGIEWHVRSRTVRNAVSARTSVPGLLVHIPPEDRIARGEADVTGEVGADGTASTRRVPKSWPWRWRTDLGGTQPFWEDWFKGLSKKFLEARGGKLLLLAGTDRLDTELTIGQMQGKLLRLYPSFFFLLCIVSYYTAYVRIQFGAGNADSMTIGKYALQVFPEAGHFIHEDLPEKTAIALVDFFRRNDRSALVLPPKVSEMLAQGKRV